MIPCTRTFSVGERSFGGGRRLRGTLHRLARLAGGAGASAPEFLVKDVVNKLISLGGEPPRELDGVIENITFSLPKELRTHSL